MSQDMPILNARVPIDDILLGEGDLRMRYALYMVGKMCIWFAASIAHSKNLNIDNERLRGDGFKSLETS